MFLSISFNNFVMCYLLHGFSTVCLLIDDFPQLLEKNLECAPLATAHIRSLKIRRNTVASSALPLVCCSGAWCVLYDSLVGRQPITAAVPSASGRCHLSITPGVV